MEDFKKNTKKKIENKIKKLIFKINYHDDLYYNYNTQEISDYEYDILRKELETIEKEHPSLKLHSSPSFKVGSKSTKEKKVLRHKTPMLSLNNAYKREEVEAFYTKNKKLFNNFKILAETKVDGLSASLIYKNRKLVKALTRGDGIKGEDITNNIIFVEGVVRELPNKFPEELEIRGEVFMPKQNFEALNSIRKKNGEQTFSTARNAASGSIRQLDPLITKKRKLMFYGYSILSDSVFFGDTLSETRKILSKYSFILNEPSKLCKNISDMMDFYEYIFKNRENLKYDIDGIVYKLDSYKQQNILGTTSRFPKWALAHKLPAEEAITKLLDVKFQIGRTGSITPVALLKEVIIGGVKVSRATLHNEDEVKRLDLKIGDTIKLQRAGDVIPKIMKVLPEYRDHFQREIIFPEVCPSCNQKLIKLKKEVVKRCTNYNNCDEQRIFRLCHFVSREALNIEGLGEKQIRFFFREKIINNFEDIFTLKNRYKNNLVSLLKYDGWGEKSILNLFESINKSSKVTFDKFIYSLGIRHIGKEVAGILSSKFNNLDNFLRVFSNNNTETLANVEGIGQTIINSLTYYFSEYKNYKLVKRLSFFLDIEYRSFSGKYLNKKIVITGTFDNFSRKYIEDKLKVEGAKITSTVSKKVDFIIVGRDSGSKLHKAKKLNIKIEDEDFVIKLMKN